jgi:ribosome maturation protein Sdo1
MTKSYYTITVRGKKHEWVFPILVDPQYVEEWRADGLIIDEVVETIMDHLFSAVERGFRRVIGL